MNPPDELSAGEFEVLTAAGPAAIAVIRVRGPRVERFVARHIRTQHPPTSDTWSPGRVLRAELIDRSLTVPSDADEMAIDDILLSVHASPPDWDLRLHLHANPWLVRRCTELLQASGLRRVTPERSTLWPSAGVLEAEAYTLLPRVLTLRGARWLLQQADRLRDTVGDLLHCPSPDMVRKTCAEIAGRINVVGWFVRPMRVVLAGPANTGKSTLANALADRAVSVVSPLPGTTRDWVEVPGEADGFPVTWIDTAGLRESDDALEAAGAARTRQLLQAADAVVVVLDADPSRAAFWDEYADLRPACVAMNKSDLCRSPAAVLESLPADWRARAVAVSAIEQTGLDDLRRVMLAGAGRTEAALDPPAAFTPRQVESLREAAAAADHNVMQERLLQLLNGATTGPSRP